MLNELIFCILPCWLIAISVELSIAGFFIWTCRDKEQKPSK